MPGIMTKVWGPGCWLFLHCMVTGYPDKIDVKNKNDINRRKHTIAFLKQLPYVLPCKYCRESFIKFSKELPVEKYANSRKQLCLWLYKMHCKVNKKLGIKDQPTFKQVCTNYDKFKAICNKSRKGCITDAKLHSKKCKIKIEQVHDTLYDNEEFFKNLSIDNIDSDVFKLPKTLTKKNEKNIRLLANFIIKSKNKVLLKQLYELLQNIIDMQNKNKHTWLIYGRNTCPFCKKAVNYMKKKNWDFEYREISEVDPDELADIYKIVRKKKKIITVPIIFRLENSKYKYIGGFSDI